jgi:hypothetical protein
MAQLSNLQAENEALKKKIADLLAARQSMGTLSCQPTEKGALSVYGLQRFPVTLYKAQWERLLKFTPELEKAFGKFAEYLAQDRDHPASKQWVKPVK